MKLLVSLVATAALAGVAAAADAPSPPVTIVLGERDLMTPAKNGKALATLIPGAKTVVLPGAGHMMLAEAPDDVLKAIAA